MDRDALAAHQVGHEARLARGDTGILVQRIYDYTDAVAANFAATHVENLAGKTDLRAYIARLQNCRLLVTNDTGEVIGLVVDHAGATGGTGIVLDLLEHDQIRRVPVGDDDRGQPVPVRVRDLLHGGHGQVEVLG